MSMEQLMKGLAETQHAESAGQRDLTMSQENDTARPDAFARREFVKLSIGAGFALGLSGHRALAQSGGAPAAAAGLKPTQQPSAFVSIAPDGSITVQSNRIDMGQGSDTAFAMILAEELDADLAKVSAVPAPFGPAYVDMIVGVQFTGGSSGVKNGFQQYRELGARTRAMFVSAAAAQWKVPAESVKVSKGVVSSGKNKATFGELAQLAMQQPVPETVKLKDPKTFALIGKPTKKLNARAASKGAKKFGIDVYLPNMKTVVVARAPVFGAKIASFDATRAKAVPGVEAVLKVEGLDRGAEGIAVIASGYWPAKLGRDALEVKWKLDQIEKPDTVKLMETYKAMAQKPGLKATDTTHSGQAAALSAAKTKIVADYSFPYLAHATMEPLNCTIDFDGKICNLHYGAQGHGVDAMNVAKVLGIGVENVRIHSQAAGGGFGRRFSPSSDYVVEAAQVMKAWRASGKTQPLKVQWSREDDTKGGYYRPLTVHRAEIGLDEANKVVAWKHSIVSPSIIAGTVFAAAYMKGGVDATTAEGIAGTPYNLPLAIEVQHPQPVVPILWWRSVGHTHTAYVMETLIDELARTKKVDPVAFRRELLAGKTRHLAALDLAVSKSGYGKKKLPKGQAWGVAVHESFNTVVAYVVEASVKDGSAVVHNVTGAVNCGLAVNPKSIETQIQGAVLMALGTTLPGAEVVIKDGVVQTGNFSEYTVARLTQMPKVAVHVVPSSDTPTGIGEVGLPPFAPALANAVAALTGKTPRSLPFDGRLGMG